MEDAIRAIERHFDETWVELRITRLPLYLALYIVLATFEGYLKSKLVAQQMISLRQGLEILIPHLLV